MSLVSIIVPIYNVEKYVEKCLNSLINQTCKDIEIWAIIDGSPDNSIEIVKRYAREDSRIRCINKENGGYGSVLEYAIERIETEYFLICDPDDWLEENAVEVLYNEAKRKKLDLVVGEFYNVNQDNSDKIHIKDTENECVDIEPNKIYENLDCGKFALLHISPHSKLFRTSCVKGVKYPKKISYTDFLLYMMAVNNSKRAMYINKPLSNYLREREGNSATDKSLKAFKAQIAVFNKIIDELDKFEYKNIYIILRLYLHVRFFYPVLLNKLPNEVINEEIENVRQSLYRIKPYKKEIKDLTKFDFWLRTIYNKCISSMLFSDLFYKSTMKYLMKKYRNI